MDYFRVADNPPGILFLKLVSRLLASCFWQLGLAHFGSLIWPTPGTLKVKRKVLRSAGAKPVGRSGSRTQRRLLRGSLFAFLPQRSAKAIRL